MQNGYLESFNGRMRDELFERKAALRPWSCSQGHLGMGRRLQPFPATLIAPIPGLRQTMPGSSTQLAPTLRKMKASRFRRLLKPPHLAYPKPSML